MTERPSPLDTLKSAAAAAGVDVERVEEEAALPEIIPSDEEEMEKQAVREGRLRALASVCFKCGDPINPDDRGILREIRGWSRARDEGGQNHVIDRRETGVLMCGPCGTRLRSGLSPEQGSLL